MREPPHHSSFHWHSSILTDTNTVAVESHSYSSVGIACMNKILRYVEVFLNKLCKCVVGSLVGIVGTPVTKSFHLLWGNIVCYQR